VEGTALRNLGNLRGRKFRQVPSPSAILLELDELEDEGLLTFPPLFLRGVLLIGDVNLCRSLNKNKIILKPSQSMS